LQHIDPQGWGERKSSIVIDLNSVRRSLREHRARISLLMKFEVLLVAEIIEIGKRRSIVRLGLRLEKGIMGFFDGVLVSAPICNLIRAIRTCENG
jgi:hypothetical protein